MKYFINYVSLLICILITIPHLSGQNEKSLSDNITRYLEYGPYPVGYKIEYLHDSNRRFSQKNDLNKQGTPEEYSRPIQVSLWYPAEKTQKADSVRYWDYIAATASEIDLKKIDEASQNQAVKEYKNITREMNCDTDLIDQDLKQPTHAWKHVPQLDGSFPLLIYIPSISGSPFQNYILIEYLVSHGYIVASFPSVGANSRTMTLDRSGVETQIDDLKFVLKKMHDFPNMDFNKIGLIGFSLGGFTNVVYAQNNREIDAVISIDGSIAYRGPKLLWEMSRFRPEEIQVPVLLMLQKIGYGLPLDMSYVNDLKNSLLYKIQFHELPHLLFSSWALKLFLADEASYKAGSTLNPHKVKESYVWMCKYSLVFINAHLKNDSSASAFLQKTPQKNGVSDGLITVTTENKPNTEEL
jgi:dienelactone hydrolase